MYLGLDLGTSGVKALLIDGEQNIVASATAALDVSRPHSGWSEQDPADWIRATEEAVAALRASHGEALAAVRGIGLSGQMHGATLVDRSDKPLRPSILWNDTRSHEEAAALDADPRFRRITGNIVFPGFTAPKLVWVARHEPDVFARVARVLLPKDYVRLWLTGEPVSEIRVRSRSGFWAVGPRSIWQTNVLCGTVGGIPPSLF
jgi:xylulokinase